MIYKKGLLLKELERRSFDIKKYSLELTRQKEPTVKVLLDGSAFYLHSSIAPAKQGQRFAQEKYVPGKDIVLFGLGLGYHVSSLIQMLQEGQSIHVLECNLDLVKLAVDNTNILDVFNSENIHIYCAEELEEFVVILKELLQMEDSNFVLYEPSVKSIPEKLLPVKELLENFLLGTRSTEAVDEQLRINFQENIRKGYPNACRIFRDKFINVPCIIVSAGPSLRENIEHLKNAKGKAMIIAIGRVFRLLEKNGIIPDLVIEIDYQPLILNRFIDIENTSVPLTMLSTSHHLLGDLYEGDKFILYEAYTFPAGEEKYTVDSGGSVATTALSFALDMGCNPIAFIGQDLCYAAEQTHFDRDKKEMLLRPGWKKVTGLSGQKYFTSPGLYRFLRWIEAKIAKHPEIVFFNCTAYGASIKGAKPMLMEELLDSLPVNKEFITNLGRLVETHRPSEQIKLFTCTISLKKAGI